MIGIAEIGTYLPAARRDNYSLAEKFGFAADFIDTKIGVRQTSVKDSGEETSDLAVNAVRALADKMGPSFDLASIGALILVTQNPDGHGLPHTSAIVHHKLGMPSSCFAFDVSLGCSGFVAGLLIAKGFMASAGIKRALLVTADPYSKILNSEDRNTVLLFGDGATATLLQHDDIRWEIGESDVGTVGEFHHALEVQDDGKLFMNGRAVFDFSVSNVPHSVKRVLEANGLAKEDVDLAILHPGSKYIVDSIAKRIGVAKVAQGNETYGNTVSSSLPLLLENVGQDVDTVLLSGFGVGLGWATTIIRRKK